jgi:hypothetical protein
VLDEAQRSRSTDSSSTCIDSELWCILPSQTSLNAICYLPPKLSAWLVRTMADRSAEPGCDRSECAVIRQHYGSYACHGTTVLHVALSCAESGTATMSRWTMGWSGVPPHYSCTQAQGNFKV